MTTLARRLAPRAVELLTSSRTRALRRSLAEASRRLRRAPHRVLYFHQVDDPYGQLAAQTLGPLLERYDVELAPQLAGPPSDAAAPERERLASFARKDAADVAPGYGLSFPANAQVPDPALVELAARVLARACGAADDFVELAPRVGAALFGGKRDVLEALARECGATDAATAREAAAAGSRLREGLGHYLGATFYYGGEWYWGVDRLHHLERRLAALGAQRGASAPDLIAPRPGADASSEPANGIGADASSARANRIGAGAAAAPASGTGADAPTAPGRGKGSDAPAPPARASGADAGAGRLVLELYASLRSPYTYLAMERALALPRRYAVELAVRPVLPMVMRGLPVPPAKRLYITLDAKREAEDAGVPFGRVCDPVGRPVERGFSLYPFACERGRGAELLHSFLRAAFAEGVETGEEAGLRFVAERAGLSWAEARAHLDSEGWRAELERNREELFALGLWGVPSFRLRGGGALDFCTFGQDRLWLVEAEIRHRLGGA